MTMHRYTARTLLLEIVMILVAIAFFFPAYILINVALKDPTDTTPDLVPTLHPTFANIANVWSQGSLGNALINSFVVTIASVLVVTAVAALASYPLARATSRWSRGVFLLFMLGLLLPLQLGLIPLYTTIRDLHLLGSLLSLVIFYVGLQTPFAVFLYTTFLRAMPIDYEEAAALDGAGSFRTFRSVVFPMLRPVTGSVIILSAVFIYNDFFTPLLYLSGSGSQTTPVALSAFVGQYQSQWNLVFAGLIISSLPILIVYFIMQRSVIQGFGGGLKG